jgi:hypothetical protein
MRCGSRPKCHQCILFRSFPIIGTVELTRICPVNTDLQIRDAIETCCLVKSQLKRKLHEAYIGSRLSSATEGVQRHKHTHRVRR